MKRLVQLVCLAVFLGLALFSTQVDAQASTDVPVYLDPKQPMDRRVSDLMGRMTLKEKIGQLNLPCVYVDELGKTVPEKIEGAKKFAAGTATYHHSGTVSGVQQNLTLFLNLDQHHTQDLTTRILSLILTFSIVGRLLMGWLAIASPSSTSW